MVTFSLADDGSGVLDAAGGCDGASVLLLLLMVVAVVVIGDDRKAALADFTISVF